MLLVSRGGTSEALDPIDETFVVVAFFVEAFAEASLPPSVGLGRDIERHTLVFSHATKPIRIIGFIGKHYGSGFSCERRFASSGQSLAWPGVIVNSNDRPEASTTAWTLVGRPPSERLIQRSEQLFSSSRHADALGFTCCRSFGYRRRKPLKSRPVAGRIGAIALR